MKHLYALVFMLLAVINARPQATAEHKPLFTLTLRVKPDFIAGAPVSIEIIKTNTSGHTIDSSFANNRGIAVSYFYECRTSDGVELKRKEHKGVPVVYEQQSTLNSGQSAKESSMISNLYNLDRAGTYTIQVSRPETWEPGAPIVKSDTQVFTIHSADMLPK